jgi:hypothetical protein
MDVVRLKKELRKSATNPEVVFLVPDWGMKQVMPSGCRTGPPNYIDWRAVTRTRRCNRLHSPVRD